MIQYAVWAWYTELLESFGTAAWGHPCNTPRSIIPTIRILLDHGGDLDVLSGWGHTVLDGLVLDYIQFDGYKRLPESLASCLDTWLLVIEDFGFNLHGYVRHEANKQQGTWHDLGLGLRMILMFNEDQAPYVWTVFQRPEELEMYEYKIRISHCAIWK